MYTSRVAPLHIPPPDGTHAKLLWVIETPSAHPLSFPPPSAFICHFAFVAPSALRGLALLCLYLGCAPFWVPSDFFIAISWRCISQPPPLPPTPNLLSLTRLPGCSDHSYSQTLTPLIGSAAGRNIFLESLLFFSSDGDHSISRAFEQTYPPTVSLVRLVVLPVKD